MFDIDRSYGLFQWYAHADQVNFHGLVFARIVHFCSRDSMKVSTKLQLIPFYC